MKIPRPSRTFWTRRRWLARLSLSFLIIAVFLAYTAYRAAASHELPRNRIILYYIAASFAFVLFLMGTRERHRAGDGEEP